MAAQSQEILLEFRAGKMKIEGSTVRPDTRKGSVRITRGEDGLQHVVWADRTSGNIEEDLIVFPEESVFERVSQSAGRVFILRFKHDDRKLMFWMQEPKADQDDQIAAEFNRLLNDAEDEEEIEVDAPEPSDSGAFEATGELHGDVSSGLGVASGSGRPASPAGVPMEGVHTRGPVQLSDLQNILSGLGSLPVPPGAQRQRDAGPSLLEVLRPERILPLLNNPTIQERLQEQLGPHLPEGHQSLQEIRELVQSPQFQQQVDAFSAALQSGQMDLSQFGVDSSKYGYSVSAFLQAIEDQASKVPSTIVGASNSEGTKPGEDNKETGSEDKKHDEMNEG